MEAPRPYRSCLPPTPRNKAAARSRPVRKEPVQPRSPEIAARSHLHWGDSNHHHHHHLVPSLKELQLSGAAVGSSGMGSALQTLPHPVPVRSVAVVKVDVLEDTSVGPPGIHDDGLHAVDSASPVAIFRLFGGSAAGTISPECKSARLLVNG